MCVALAAVPIIMSAVGAGASAYGSIQQGNAQAAAANYTAKTDALQAQSVEDSARINEQETYRQGDELEGRARAAEGANGIDPNSGTALLTQEDIGRRTGQNVADQGYNADVQAWGYRNNSSLLVDQAANDQQAGAMGAATSLIGGASQVAGKWSAFQQNTPSPSSGSIAGSGVSPAGWGASPGNTNWAASSWGT